MNPHQEQNRNNGGGAILLGMFILFIVIAFSGGLRHAGFTTRYDDAIADSMFH